MTKQKETREPIRMKVAKHYMLTGKKFTYLDIARDFGMAETTATGCFAGISLAGKYITRLYRSSRPYQMEVLDIREKIEYTKPRHKQKPIKKNPKTFTDEAAALRAQFCGLRG